MAKAKPTDTTGKIIEAARAAQIEEAEKRTAEMAMATAQAKVDLETKVIDATSPNKATVIVDEVIEVANKEEETVEIRVVEDINSMTFGAGNYFSFKAGQRYKVTKPLANHLKELGYLANTY